MDDSFRDHKYPVAEWRHVGRAYFDEEGVLQLRPRSSYDPLTKLRRAYKWIAQNKVICPYYDIQFSTTSISGQGGGQVDLAQNEAYASYLLLPLLTLMVSGRMLIVGGVGRGKTSLAVLMGMLVGYSYENLQMMIQHGHPQLTVTDLVGSPLPADLIRAETLREVHVSWRSWIQAQVKIIDEYNRIPTKTQSALLSLLSEGYAEAFEQIVQAGEAAWFLTANDDIGGGTFPVIDALKDRIEVIAHSTPVYSGLMRMLQDQMNSDGNSELFFPKDIVLTQFDLAAIRAGIDSIVVDGDALDVVGSFLAQLDFCQQASHRLEYMSKDTIRLSGGRLAQVCNEDCPLDKRENICTQTEGGVSVRVFKTIIRYAKALAYFRAQKRVALADLRAIIPWALNEKIKPNPASAFFQIGSNSKYLLDQISWIVEMFDLFLQQYSRHTLSRGEFLAVKRKYDESVLTKSLIERVALQGKIYNLMSSLVLESELNGFVHEDLISLKHMHYNLGSQVSK